MISKNLHGFDAITKLATPLPHHVTEGIFSKQRYGLNRHALTGVRKFTTMKDMLGSPDGGLARNDLINGGGAGRSGIVNVV